MNGGEVVVCDDCGDPYEVLLRHRFRDDLTCPYCGS